ncbi:MAG TPA: OB-fold domain-containing protein [Acidimicrobiia bacterium]|nr:OB-fold domain-containing protein [Acidimicrobiia bacterium]
MSFQEHRITAGIGADDGFWAALEAGELRLPRCAGCRRWTWPAHWRCGECGSWDFRWTALEPVGTVYSWSRTWYPFDRTKERAGDVPYVVVLVEVDGADGARVLGVLAGDEAPLKIGARVSGTILAPSEKTKGYPSIVWSLS